MKPVLIPALDLWASWQREAVLNITQAALMPMAALASMARFATSACGQKTESSKSVGEEFNRSADRLIAASDEAVSERFAAVAHQAEESLREAVAGLSEASKELSRVAREAGEALKKDAKSAADEIRQAGKNSEKAAARGGDGSRKKKSAKAAGSSRESNGHRRKSARSSERRAH